MNTEFGKLQARCSCDRSSFSGRVGGGIDSSTFFLKRSTGEEMNTANLGNFSRNFKGSREKEW